MMLIDLFKRLNWQQTVVVLGLLLLAGFAISQMPSELWSKIPAGVYWALGGSAGLVAVQTMIGKLFHPTPEKARAEAIATITASGHPPPRDDEPA